MKDNYLKEYVFTLDSYKCNKNCPYCIAKMNNLKSNEFDNEINLLKNNIKVFKDKKIKFKYFILSGNGETSLYSKEELEVVKKTVESSKIFDEYRIQTSGYLFNQSDKLKLFENWIKEITVVSFDSKEDKEFYKYKNSYLDLDEFIKSSKIRVNIVLLKNNFKNIVNYINRFSDLNNVETIALKILDNSNNNTKESDWIKENALSYDDITIITEELSKNYKFIKYIDNRFVYISKEDKLITLNYNTKNNYDYISVNKKEEFSWHNTKIKKGIYGEFSKVEEEIMEAKDALEQSNQLMFLIELSDIVGAIEGIIAKYNLDIFDILNFSNKVKESKMINNEK